MIDIHCHLPVNISDGPETIEDAVAMLEKAAADGVTYITAVSHYGKYLDQLKDSVAHLQKEADRFGITLHPAFEYDYVHLDEVKTADLQFIGPRSSYILLDFHRSNIPFSAPMRLCELVEENVSIVIVHPEKLFGPDSLPMLQHFVDGGMVLHVNALSFLPDAPSSVRKMAHLLMRKGLVQVVASDAHRKTGLRRYVMAEARRIVAKKYGEEIAEMIFEINPSRILEDRPPLEMPVQMSYWERLRRRWTGR